ncbi:uncharacterized protein LOC144165965 [Haemaphysalis longicornis]
MAPTCGEKTRRRLFQEEKLEKARNVSSTTSIPDPQCATDPSSDPRSATAQANPPRPKRKLLPLAQPETNFTRQFPVDTSSAANTGFKEKLAEIFKRVAGHGVVDLEHSSTYVAGDLWTPSCHGQRSQNQGPRKSFPIFVRRSLRRRSYQRLKRPPLSP